MTAANDSQPISAGRSRRHASACCSLRQVAGMVAFVASASYGASLIPEGRPAPDFTLPALDGTRVSLSAQKGTPVILLFGEMYNPNSVPAAREVAAVLARPVTAELAAKAFLVTTQPGMAADLSAEAEKLGVTLPILRDSDRRTFAAYRVYVLPSVVVLDPNGVTVWAEAGYPLDFQDAVTDALLRAGGKLSAEEFARRREQPTSQPTTPETHVRALRLAALGEQLVQRGSEELAIDQFEDALTLNPDCGPANIGLGECLLRRRELARAEQHFRRVLGSNSDSVAAAMGLAHIQILRGGRELAEAESSLARMTQQHPHNAKVVYLAGLVAETSGDAATALGRYRRAAELLLYGQIQRAEQP